jgi:hypothetical protein
MDGSFRRGFGRISSWHYPDEMRKWVLENKSKELTDKTMNVKEAVSKFAHDRDVTASGDWDK